MKITYSKRIGLVLLSAILAFSTAGCGKVSTENVNNQQKTAETSQTQVTNSSIDKELLKNYKYGDWISFNEDGSLKKDDRGAKGKNGVVSSQRYEAVSYTHLTLPTICSV